MTARPPGSQVAKIIRAIDRFNSSSSKRFAGSNSSLGHSTTYRTERFVQSGSEVLTVGKLVNSREHMDVRLVLSWEFGADGRLCGVEVRTSDAETLIPI